MLLCMHVRTHTHTDTEMKISRKAFTQIGLYFLAFGLSNTHTEDRDSDYKSKSSEEQFGKYTDKLFSCQQVVAPSLFHFHVLILFPNTL